MGELQSSVAVVAGDVKEKEEVDPLVEWVSVRNQRRGMKINKMKLRYEPRSIHKVCSLIR